jgi:hypothetical protein
LIPTRSATPPLGLEEIATTPRADVDEAADDVVMIVHVFGAAREGRADAGRRTNALLFDRAS